MIRYVVLLCMAASGALACPKPPEAVALISEDEQAPSAYALIGSPPVSAPFKIDISFCNLDDAAKSLEFDAIMPAHQHGMNFDVDVVDLGNSVFEVSNVVLHMPGLWEIQVEAVIGAAAYAYRGEVLLE